MAARRETWRRYLIYPRFRYQSPTKGDATTRRASATRSHEPSRGTKLLFSVSLLSTSTGARSRSSLSLSLRLSSIRFFFSLSPSLEYSQSWVPCLSSSSSNVSSTYSFVSHGTPRSLDVCSRSNGHAHARVVARNITYTQGTCRRAPTCAHAV